MADPATLEEIRRRYGDSVAGYADHPEIGPILEQGVREGRDGAWLIGQIQQTNWWRSTSDAARKWELLWALDPATAQQRWHEEALRIRDAANALGVSLLWQDATNLAWASASGGWDNDRLEHELRKHFAGQPHTLDAMIRTEFGYLAAFASDPEVANLLQRAVAEGWDENRLNTEIQQTNWWKNTSESQRNWDALVSSDPASTQAKLTQRTQEIQGMAGQMGVFLMPERVTQMATDSLRNGWTQAQLQAAIAAEFEYGKSSTELLEQFRQEFGRYPTDEEVRAYEASQRGQGQSLAQQLKDTANAYLVPLSAGAIDSWVTQILGGSADLNAFESYVRTQAKSRFPHLASAIDSGVTVRQYADPFVELAAKELGIAPASVDLIDPKWMRALEGTPSNDGTRAPMSLWEWQRELRTNPIYGYDSAPNARQASAEFQTALLTEFGRVA